MIIANAAHIASMTADLDNPVHRLNAAVVALTGGKLPCHAIAGKRSGFRWVSVGSSCVISRGQAARWLRCYEVDIDAVELVGVLEHAS